MHTLSRSLHNWLGIILAAQISLWFLSGLVMAWLPIDEVRGTHLKIEPKVSWAQAQVAPASVLAKHSPNALLSFSHRVLVDPLRAEPVYQVEDGNSITRYSALTGNTYQAIQEDDIQQLAVAQYKGTASISSVRLLEVLPQEVSHLTPPLWQVVFNDEDNTHFYLSPTTGKVERVRTDTWRLFDFMWMLHIMDYEERSDFNHPLLIAFAASALLFTFTGFILLYYKFRPRRKSRIFY